MLPFRRISPKVREANISSIICFLKKLYHVNTNIAQVIKILHVRQPIFIILQDVFWKKLFHTKHQACIIRLILLPLKHIFIVCYYLMGAFIQPERCNTPQDFRANAYVGYQQYKYIFYYNGFVRLTKQFNKVFSHFE